MDPASLRRSRCSTACQYAALFTWPRRSTSVARSGQGSASRRFREPAARGGRDRASFRSVRIQTEALEPGGPSVGAEVDPDAVELDPPAAITHQRHPAAGGQSCRSAAPRRQLDVIVLDCRRHDLDPDVTHDPQMVGGAPPGLVDVVHRHVLEIARDCVQPQPSGGVPVGEPDAPAGAKHPACGRQRDEAAAPQRDPAASGHRRRPARSPRTRVERRAASPDCRDRRSARCALRRPVAPARASPPASDDRRLVPESLRRRRSRARASPRRRTPRRARHW